MARKRSKQAQIIFEALQDLVRTTGVELVDVRYVKEGKAMFLRIFVDKSEGVDMSDCEAVSRLIDPVIDNELKLSTHDYLEVQSCGLDWSLDDTSDRLRHLGEMVEVVLDVAQTEAPTQSGTLMDATDDKVVLKQDDGQVISYDATSIKSIKRKINWN